MVRFCKCLFVLALCTAVAVGAAGCNTLKGVGKDIERGGEELQEVAE